MTRVFAFVLALSAWPAELVATVDGVEVATRRGAWIRSGGSIGFDVEDSHCEVSHRLSEWRCYCWINRASRPVRMGGAELPIAFTLHGHEVEVSARR